MMNGLAQNTRSRRGNVDASRSGLSMIYATVCAIRNYSAGPIPCVRERKKFWATVWHLDNELVPTAPLLFLFGKKI